MSPAAVRAGNLICEWMEDAGLRTWVHCLGHVHGRVEGTNASDEDIVVDAGIFDGSLGIISMVIAFSDEEGVRFQSTFIGSAAIAGILPVSALQITDKSAVTIQDALKKNSIEEQLRYDPKSVWGYIEIHIEQGPVLEWVGFPLGVVKGIAGQTRLKVTMRGSQGHAGTVSMMRHDPMAAAAEAIVLLESLCKHPQDFLSFDGQCKSYSLESLSTSLVCTVGEISTWPSASNVIPGQVTFTVDLRAIDDMGREAVVCELSNRLYQICDRRSASCTIDHKHDANAVICDSELTSKLKSAAYLGLKRMTGSVQDEVPVLMSGAGHDTMALSHLTKVGMLFVRCRGGISHFPEEHVLDDMMFGHLVWQSWHS
ncbi:putative allantoate deiminase [Rosa chinensis]|uniref:allantoate deiminase n=1 Tax=Rosa chinensis TaxID=74649 RepID=A0A2P6S7A3_ROSCH|nr:putative allantoate deiminase [Rosa chinensis]